MARQLPVVWRSTFEMLSTLAFLVALPHVKLAEMSALSQASPALATLLATFVFGERVTLHRWAATIGGIIGVMMILKPDPAGFNAWSLLALASAMSVAVRDIFSSRIATRTPALATTFLAAAMI